ncbi:hypothetical protein JW707_00605 [Candidatus Woesearchaeota archaeon]|nr:hypothetical protein [Candidatus Woesearchaeota archaeon]
MLLNAEDRAVYWGYMHMNVACRDVNNDDEADITGLERILYDVGFLAITKFVKVKPYEPQEDGVSEDNEERKDEEQETLDYEPVDEQLDPFNYSLPEENDILLQGYSIEISETESGSGKAEMPADEEDEPSEESGKDEEPDDEEEDDAEEPDS